MSYVSGNDHSLADFYTFPSFHEPLNTSELGQDHIFRKLSLVLSAAEVLRLCDIIRTSPQEVIWQSVEHQRHDGKDKKPSDQVKSKLIQAVASSSSSALEQQPLVKDCHSQPFSMAWPENVLPHATSDGYDHSGAATAHSGVGLNNYNSLSPDGLTAYAAWNVCIACDQSYALPSGLGKHQRDMCERARYWECPLCQHQMFEKLSELYQHHLSIHGGTCSDCGNAVQSSPSANCKMLLSRCSVKILKKAWGCPCCIDCFDTMEDWNKHKISHHVQNEKVANWSFSTMFRSLLGHRDLLMASRKYNWSLCSWDYLSKDDCRKLKSALERHVLPSNWFDTEADSRLGMPDSLVSHAFKLGAVRSTSAAPLNDIGCQIATNPVPAYSNVPIDQFSRYQHVNSNFQQLDGIEKGHEFQSDENPRRTPNTFNMAVDHEELASLDDPFVEYMRGIGGVKTRPSDDQGYLRNHQGPATLASHVPSSQNCLRVRLKTVKHGRGARNRTPIGKGQCETRRLNPAQEQEARYPNDEDAIPAASKTLRSPLMVIHEDSLKLGQLAVAPFQ